MSRGYFGYFGVVGGVFEVLGGSGVRVGVFGGFWFSEVFGAGVRPGARWVLPQAVGSLAVGSSRSLPQAVARSPFWALPQQLGSCRSRFQLAAARCRADFAVSRVGSFLGPGCSEQ